MKFLGKGVETSAYGFSFSMENWDDSVAAAYLAAADSLPTFPILPLSQSVGASMQEHTPVIAVDAYRSVNGIAFGTLLMRH